MKLERAALGLAILAVAAAAGYLAYGSLRPEEPPKAQVAVAAPVAERIPNIALPDLEGRPRHLSEWQGRPLLINFWATWCEPCRREIPLLKKIRADYAAKGLAVLGIAIDFPEPVSAYARDAKIDYPILIAADDATVAQAFGVGMGLPTTVFAAADGRIVSVQVGELHRESAERLIRSLLETP
jgi:thiol-disulfide isomerase/thioredoxin